MTVLVISFLSATLIPMSSEILISSLIFVGKFNPILIWFLATIGNILGSLVNWILGMYCLRWKSHRWFPFSDEQLVRARIWFNQYGTWTLLMAWLPIIGDPLTFGAGVLRVPMVTFLTLITVGKAARYALIIFAASKLQ